MFFLISGFLCAMKWEKNASGERKAVTFYKEKVLRIIPPYYFGLMFWWFLVVNKGIAPKPYGMEDIISHLLFIHTFSENTFFSTSGVFWYVGVQMHFYLLFPLIIRFLDKLNKPGRILLFLASFIPIIALSTLGTNHSTVAYWNVIMFMPSFLGGILLYKKDFDTHKNLTALICGVVYVGIILVPQLKESFLLSNRIVAGICLGISLYYAWPMYSKLPSALKDFVRLISVTSYSIYLYNYIMYTYRIMLDGKTGLFIYVPMTLGFGVLMYYLIEKPISQITAGLIKDKKTSMKRNG